MLNRTELWSKVHDNNIILQESLGFLNASHDSDLGWLKFLTNNTPNGFLLKNNIIYDLLKENKKVYLAHVTKNFSALVKSEHLLSSSGCLVGSVYCTPLIDEGSNFRLHNLGGYILNKEAKAFSKDRDDIALLIVELELNEKNCKFPIGINYLKLGDVHFSIFSDLNYLLSHDELSELKYNTISAVKKVSDFLILIDSFSSIELLNNFENFYSLYINNVKHLPILGYLLFEVVSEYISLFQQGPKVEHFNSLNEIYCSNFKDLIFDLYPNLTLSFNLGYFQPNLNDLKKYLKRKNILLKNDHITFEKYLLTRLTYLMHSYFYSSNTDLNIRRVFWQNIEWNFEYLKQQLTPLLGHTIHRLLRNMHRYPNFYYYFDQYKALEVWNYWNHSSIALPYNSVLPKGEIGINPANPYMKYKVYSANFWQNDEHFYATPNKELSIAIEPRLTELKMSFMRRK